jgi:hypothetical protein
MPQQQSFELETWGGRRRGAGRKPRSAQGAIPHTAREEVRRAHPVQVTFRFAETTWNLRSERSYRIIDAALRAMRRRPDFRVVHFSVQGNHPEAGRADRGVMGRPVLLRGDEGAARGAGVAVRRAGDRGGEDVVVEASGGRGAVMSPLRPAMFPL